jgi:lysophospholipase L1-like esterase
MSIHLLTGLAWFTVVAHAVSQEHTQLSPPTVDHAAEKTQHNSVGNVFIAQPNKQTASPESRSHQAAPQQNPLFMPAHRALLNKAKLGVIDVYFLGDSITRRWQATDYPAHKKNWDRNFYGWNAANFGWGGDTTQNVLWRLQNGEMDDVNPKVVVLMIGTNNLGNSKSSSELAVSIEIVTRGIRAILDTIRAKAPAARIVLMAITPRAASNGIDFMPAIDQANSHISAFADGETIVFLNINEKLADRNGRLFDGVTEDGLHLSVTGYQIWAEALKPFFTQWLGPPAPTDHAPPATGIPTIDTPQDGVVHPQKKDQ